MLTRRVEVDRRVCQGFVACIKLISKSFHFSEEDGKTKRTADPAVDTNEVINLEKSIFDDLTSYGQVDSVYPFIAKGR